MLSHGQGLNHLFCFPIAIFLVLFVVFVIICVRDLGHGLVTFHQIVARLGGGGAVGGVVVVGGTQHPHNLRGWPRDVDMHLNIWHESQCVV